MGYSIYGYGHDFGNAECCTTIISNGTRIERRIPSVACIGSWRSVVASANGVGKSVQEIMQPDHYVLEYDHLDERRIEKYIGQKVFDDGAQPMSTHGATDRYWINNYSLEMLMVASASMVPDSEYGLHVVTGLPITTYLQDDGAKEQVQKALIGTHHFMLNGRERTVHVLSVKVIMEGAGALLAYGTNQDVLQGVIDIGGLTTDLYVAKGQKPRAANSSGFKMGVTAAADLFNNKFVATYHYHLTMETRKALLSQFVHGQVLMPVRDKKAHVIDSNLITTLINEALREIGQEITTAILAQWDDIIMEMGTILIVGGGAYYFAADIQSRLMGVRRAQKPEFANVAGYAALAEALAKRSQTQLQKGA